MTGGSDRPPCSCSDCRSACTYKPGWFLPGEAEKLAANMGVSLAQLFKTSLAVDFMGPDERLDTKKSEEYIYVLSPAVTRNAPGTEFPYVPFGTCTFYDEGTGACRVHDAGKPAECRKIDHAGVDDPDLHFTVARAWKEHQGLIKELLGRDPEPPPPPTLAEIIATVLG